MNALASSFDRAVEELMEQIIGLEGNEDFLYSRHSFVVQEIHGNLIHVNGEIPDIYEVTSEVMGMNERIIESIAELDFETGRGSAHSCWEAIDMVSRRYRINGFSEKEAIHELWTEGILSRITYEMPDVVRDLLMESDLAFTADNWDHPIRDIMPGERSVSVVVNDCQNVLFLEWQEDLVFQYAHIKETECNWRVDPYTEELYDLVTSSLVYPERRK